MSDFDRYRICEDCRYAEFDEDDFGRRSISPEYCKQDAPEPYWNDEAECFDCNYHDEWEDVRW